MKGIVTNLCDISSIPVPEELLNIYVDEQSVQERMDSLSLRYAEESSAQTAEKGDIVYCTADSASYPDGRQLILFTGTEMPGAQEAAEAAVGKAVGEAFKTCLLEKPVELKIDRIVRRTPAELDDKLIASLGIEGVADVPAYRSYLKEKMLADLRMERSKELTHYYMDELIDGSSFEYDEGELRAYAEACLDEWKTEYAAMDIEASDEEILRGVESQTKQEWVADAICKMLGHETDMEQAEADADRMIEMMTLMGENVPSREEMIKMSVRDDKFNVMFGYIDEKVTEIMGGSNGNS